jgi:hypothetical protein
MPGLNPENVVILYLGRNANFRVKGGYFMVAVFEDNGLLI